MAVRCNSERGRTEYLLVSLVPGPEGLAAYPMGKGSGSVTTFSRADGFLVIPRQQEYVDRGERGEDHPAGTGNRAGRPRRHRLALRRARPAAGLAAERGIRSKTLWVGSQGGLDAAARGECDLAGVHLLDPSQQHL